MLDRLSAIRAAYFWKNKKLLFVRYQLYFIVKYFMNQWIIPGLIGFIRYDLFVMNKKKKVSKKKCIIWIMQSGYHCNPFIDQLFDQLNNSELIVKIKMTYGFIQYQYFWLLCQ